MVSRTAEWLSRRRPALRADIEQEMWAGIVERAASTASTASTPSTSSGIGSGTDGEEFLAQKPAYIVQYAAWKAQEWLRGLLRDEEHEGAELDAPLRASTPSTGSGAGSAAGESGDVTAGDLVVDTRAERGDPMAFVLPRLVLERIVDNLRDDPVAAALIVGTLLGYRKREVARRLGVSEQATQRARARVAVAMAAEMV